MASKKVRQYRGTFLAFVLLVAALFGGLASGVQWSDAKWAPGLGLDLAGGTQIILEPVATDGDNSQITEETINEAIAIMRKRVDSSGFTEAQISSQGGSNIVVELPGDPEEQKETRELVRQSAQMNYRPVLQLAFAQPPPDPNAEGGEGENAEGENAGGENADGQPAEGGETPAEGATDGATPEMTGTPTAGGDATKGGETPAADATESANNAVLPRHLLQGETPAAGETPAEGGTATGDQPAEGEGAAGEGAAGEGAAGDGAAGDGAAGEGGATPGQPGQPEMPVVPDPSQPAAGAGPTNPSDLAWITPELSAKFQAEDCSDRAAMQARSDQDFDKAVVICDQEGFFKYILGPVEVKGSDIKDAYAGMERNSQGQPTNRWAVYSSYDGDGVDDLRELTSRVTSMPEPQNQFAIVLDGLVLSAPRSNAVIPDGNAMITGDYTQESATELANQLKFGALPLSFEVQTEAQISALLGKEQLRLGLLAGIIGLILVMLYSVAQYRLLGLVTVSSLLVMGAMTYATIALLGWYQGYRLSLAGVTGLIVAIGITVDSFIVYFERIRDELRDGKPLASAVESAWSRARRTIIISDCINFLAAAVLYYLSVGAVQGFAFTLGLTTLIDLIIVIMFTHPLIGMLSRTRLFASGHPASGLSEAQLTYATAYAGRGRVRTPDERNLAGLTLAQRRAALAEADDNSDESESDTEPAKTSSGGTSAKED